MKHKYTLIMLLNHSSKELAQHLFAFGEGWPLFRDHKFQLIDKEQYEQLVTAGEIGDSSFWRVNKYGLIMLSAGTTYSGTYEKLKQGLCDYKNGWDDAMRVAQPTLELGRLRFHAHRYDRLETTKRPKRMKLGRLTHKP